MRSFTLRLCMTFFIKYAEMFDGFILFDAQFSTAYFNISNVEF
jgi:hypothetical protein